MKIGSDCRVTTRVIGFRRRGKWTLRFIRRDGRITVATGKGLWTARKKLERELGGYVPRPDFSAIGRLAGQIITQRLAGYPETVTVPSNMSPTDVHAAIARAEAWLCDGTPDAK